MCIDIFLRTGLFICEFHSLFLLIVLIMPEFARLWRGMIGALNALTGQQTLQFISKAVLSGMKH